MKKSGYTLVELLGILAVMAIMLLIIVPSVITTVKNADTQKQEIFERTIEQAAESYVESHMDMFPELNNSEIAFGKIGTLIDAGYLKSTLVDPSTNEKIDVDSYFSVEVNHDMTKKYAYLKDARPVSEIVEPILANNQKYTYMGGTYVKGSVSTNYAWYNGFLWRIMGKNPDGSIRMITEENVTTIPWGDSGTSHNYPESYIKDWVNHYFLSRLKDTSEIVDSNFCEDNVGVSNGTSARTTCTNIVSSKAGILTMDEYNLSGGSAGYLNNKQYYWTLTPHTNNLSAWYVEAGGSTASGNLSGAFGVRTVISISPDTIVTAGNGNLTAGNDTEYILNQTLDDVSGNTLRSRVGAGDYLIFNNRPYRVMEKTEVGVKLILDNFYIKDTAYGSNFTTLNSLITTRNFLNWLVPNNQAQMIDTTWYRGDYWSSTNYKNALSNTNSFTGLVGLPKAGEILASQSLSLITKNYSVGNSSSNTKGYWLLTPHNASNSWKVDSDGRLTSTAVTTSYGVRPVIMIQDSLTIRGGNGTMSNPYRV